MANFFDRVNEEHVHIDCFFLDAALDSISLCKGIENLQNRYSLRDARDPFKCSVHHIGVHHLEIFHGIFEHVVVVVPMACLDI